MMMRPNRSISIRHWIALTLATALILMLVPTQGHSKNKPCTLRQIQGPLTIEDANHPLRNLHINSEKGPALTIRNAANLTLENILVHHRGGRGVLIENSPNLTLRNLVVVSTDAPASGPHRGSRNENIVAYRSHGLRIENARLYKGSSGAYLLQTNKARLSGIYGEDFRGPFPRGQFVQLDKSHQVTLENFYTRSYSRSWPEDNINVYRSFDAQIRDGLIDGNNAPSGVGVIFDGGTSTGSVIDVDALHMGNGAFSAYDGADQVSFVRTRARDDICHDQGRGRPLSSGSLWTGHPRLKSLTIKASIYFNPCNQVVWPTTAFATTELSRRDFTPRKFSMPAMCWES